VCDEVGSNTSQKNDGNIGGEKFLIGPDSQVQIGSSFKDCHFTVLGFTVTNGQLILCMIILACKYSRWSMLWELIILQRLLMPT